MTGPRQTTELPLDSGDDQDQDRDRAVEALFAQHHQPLIRGNRDGEMRKP